MGHIGSESIASLPIYTQGVAVSDIASLANYKACYLAKAKRIISRRP